MPSTPRRTAASPSSGPRATTATRAVPTAPPTSRSCTRLQYAFRDRRARKGEFRQLWIQRINAACRQNGISYSRFIAGLQAGGRRGRPQGPRRPGRHRRAPRSPPWSPPPATRSTPRRPRPDLSGHGVPGEGGRWPNRSAPGNHTLQRLRRLSRRREARSAERRLRDRRARRCSPRRSTPGSPSTEVVRRARRPAEPARPGRPRRARPSHRCQRRRRSAGVVDTVTPQPVAAVAAHRRRSTPRRGRGRRRPAGARAGRACPTPATPARCCARPRPPGAGAVRLCDGSRRPLRPQGACGRSAARCSACRSSGPPTPATVLAALAGAGASAPWPPSPGAATPYDDVDLTGPRGARARQRGPRPARRRGRRGRPVRHDPDGGRTESLNVAMAGTVAAASRRCASGGPIDWTASRRERQGSRRHDGQRRLSDMLDDHRSTRSAGSRTSARERASPPPPRSTSCGPSRPSCSARVRADTLLKARSAASTPTSAATVGQALNAAREASRRRAGRAPRRARGRRAGPSSSRPSGSTSPRCCPAAPAGPPPPRHPGHRAARGRLRRHGLHRGRGPRGRDRLVQLRGAQLRRPTTRPASM